MAQNKMQTSKSELIDHLISAVKELPVAQIEEVSDFVRDLQAGSNGQLPERGSMDAILQALQHTGPLQFEENELETLLVEIETMRDLDLDKHD